MILLRQTNVVLIANTFNLPIFHQVWLIDNDIITKDEFAAGESFFTPVAVNVRAPSYNFLIVPERAQVAFNSDFENSLPVIQRVIGGIASKLPHTPYTAMGLNFEYRIGHKDPKYLAATYRDVFLCKNNPLVTEFSSEDTMTGLYVSKDMFGARLKLDIKPIIADGNNMLQLVFNTHLELSDTSEIHRLIGLWEENFQYAKHITESMQNILEVE
ncbi:MAG TPA: hypothetical protein ENJ80_12965 [Gammaproteobacteria bacterium]|nr:hypothetical protein [Gammaproteobacteria bacterium]